MLHPEIPETAMFLLRRSEETALGTIENGSPFVSAAGFIYTEDTQEIILLLSDLARHARNLKASPAVSLLLTDPAHDIPIHEKKRVTLLGKACRVSDAGRTPQLQQLYLGKYPRAGVFLQLSDFHFYSILPMEMHWIAGFGNAGTWKR